MRRIVSLFIFSILLFILITGSGFSSVQIDQVNENNNEPTESILANNNYEPNHSEPDNSAIQQIDHYTSYDEIETILRDISSRYRKITKLYDNRGTTSEGRTIWMIKISDSPNVNEDSETDVLFVGAHHGDEAIGNEMALLIINTFTSGYGKDPRITWLVDNHEIWVIPMPNPDGLEYTLNSDSWRKNRSPNYISEVTPGPIDPKLVRTSYGTDLNRNYDFQWGDPEGSSILLQRSPTYAGSEPFSELETQAIRDLTLAHNFSVYVDYHSGIELILYPWGYTNEPTPDNELFERVAEELARLTGYDAIQGYDLYQTNGDSVDWIYHTSRTLSWTVELSRPKMPDPTTIQPILDNHIKLPLYLTGISTDKETGSKIRILHENIGNQSDLGPYSVTATVNGMHRYSDLDVKLYYKVNNNDFNIVTMQNSDENTKQFKADIPTQGPDSKIEYFIAVANDEIMVSSPDLINRFEITIMASEESIPTNDEIIAMIIMMIIILGFFWGGFGYAARMAMFAERRKLHDYIYGDSDSGLEPYRPELAETYSRFAEKQS